MAKASGQFVLELLELEDTLGGQFVEPSSKSIAERSDDSDNPILNILARADRRLKGLEDSALNQINSALEGAYSDLESKLLDLYSREESSLLGRQRAAVLIAQVSDLLTLLNPDTAAVIQQEFENLIQLSTNQGSTLARELSQAVANEPLQATAQIPLDAIVNQATEGMQRLSKHQAEFADRASTLVTQGLVQGWGTEVIRRELQRELGISRYNAERIARTESLAASNGAIRANLERNNIPWVIWQATADDRACPVCISRNQKVYMLEDVVMPCHPFDRCVLAPCKPEWLQQGLMDTAWMARQRQQSINELRDLGLEPDDGASPFEKADGRVAPIPVWEPGDGRLDWLEDWHEDKLCGKSAIPDSKTCHKGVDPGHPASNPKNAKHPDWLAAMTTQANDPKHPFHAASVAAIAATKSAPAPAATPAKKTSTRKKAATPAPATPPPAQPATPAKAKRGSKKAAAQQQPAIAKTPHPAVKLNQPELDSKRADLEKRFGKKLVGDAEANLKKVLDDSDVFIRVGSTSTLEMIANGGFKTAHELGRTAHSIPNLKDNYLDARARVEGKSLGYDANTPDSDRPIYGYLGGKDLNGRSHADVGRDYGSIAVKLRPEAKDRSTFTGADTFKSGIASPVNDPNAASVVAFTRHGFDRDNLPKHYPGFMRGDQNDQSMLQAAAKAKGIDDLVPNLAPTGAAYMEAQVHGGVKPKDIAEIHFSPKGVSDRPNAAIAKFAKDNGVDLYVNGKKLSSTELDDLANPKADKRSQRVKDLNDAIDKDDFDAITQHAAKIHSDAEALKLSPGERDRYLKQAYADAGFDGLPKVGTAQDVTDAWKDGGVLMVRGVGKDSSPDGLGHLRQFQTGDYHVGNGIYGNGTYVGHAGRIKKDGTFVGYNAKTEKADAKRAFDDVAKHSYINANTANFRMALTKDAVVVSQSKLMKERDAFETRLDNWADGERAKLTAGAKVYTAKDVKSYQSKLKAAQSSYDAKAPKVVTAMKQKMAMGGTRELQSWEFPSTKGGKSIRLTVEKVTEVNVFGTRDSEYTVKDAQGNVVLRIQGAPKPSQKVMKGLLDHAVQIETLKSMKLNAPPVVGDMDDPVVAKKLQVFNDKLDQVKTVLGLDHNGESRFAVLRGYDAIALNQSYEKNTFMNLLNRSKVVIQKDPLDYNRAKQVGAL